MTLLKRLWSSINTAYPRRAPHHWRCSTTPRVLQRHGRWWVLHTTASNAHRIPRRESLACGSGGLAAVLAPHMSTTGTPVAAHGQQQRRRPPPEGLVSQLAGHGIAYLALLAATSTPSILVDDPARQHRLIGSQALAGHPARAHRGGRTSSGQEGRKVKWIGNGRISTGMTCRSAPSEDKI